MVTGVQTCALPICFPVTILEVECGHCFECRKKKRREWRIRNYEQLKETPHAVFFTGTVSPQRYEYICKKYGFKNDGSQDN